MIEENSKDWFEKRLGMVIKIWKDSNTLQVFSTKMNRGFGKVTRRNGRDSITVKYPKGVITYQKHMGGVDHQDHHRLMGTGLENSAHFKNRYKKSYLGITGFIFLQGFK